MNRLPFWIFFLLFLCIFSSSCRRPPTSPTPSTSTSTKILPPNNPTPPAVPSQSLGKPNLIVLTMDTTRADRLGCYGNKAIQTPHLDKFAQEGVRFTQAISHISLTLPSHSSMFTGKYPIGHCVHDNIGFKLPEENETLAEYLKKQGYETGAFVSTRVLDKQFQLNQGFEEYEQSLLPNKSDRNAEAVLSYAQPWLAQRKNPFFAWIHFYDPHLPHEAPEPFKSLYQDSYNAEIAYLDSQLGLLFQFLKEKNIYDNSIIVVLADHGESMGEHNEPTHGYFAYDSTLHIPFILKPHRQSPPFASVIENQVRIIDMMPTVLTLLQIPVPSSVQGESLTPLFYQQKKTLEGLANYCYGECFLPYNKYHFSGIETLRTEPYRFIQNKFHEGVYELYDLKKDPKELVNIIEKEPQVAQELRQKLKEIIELYTEKYDAEMTLDTRTRAALHALGYTIGRKDKPKEGELLPVAQEQIHHHNRLIRANKDIADGKYQEAQEKISKVTDIHPNLLFAHDLQATLNFKIQKYQEAISALNKVIEADDKDTVSRQKRAMCYYGLGDGKKTIEEFQEILKIEPTYDEAKANLWKLYIFHKYEDRALAQIEEEIKNNPRKGFGYFWRAKLLQHQNKWVEAKQDYELSLADPELTYEAHLELIKIYRVLNEFDNAIRSLKACLSFQPDNVSNLFQLALFLKNSDKKEAENLLKKALFLNPKDFSILQHLFHLYLQEENSQDAHELMQKALELKLDEKDIKIFQNALVNLVRLHLKKNEKEMAYEFLRYLLKYEFTPTEKMALIQMLLELDKLHEALNYLIDLTQNYPEFYTAHFSLGQLSFNLKIWNQSIQSFENFLKKYPQKNDDLVLRAYRYLSESYIRNNNIDPAIASLTTYLELHPKESLNTAQEASIKQAETLLQRLKDIKAETLKQEEEKKSPTSENTTHEKK